MPDIINIEHPQTKEIVTLKKGVDYQGDLPTQAEALKVFERQRRPQAAQLGQPPPVVPGVAPPTVQPQATQPQMAPPTQPGRASPRFEPGPTSMGFNIGNMLRLGTTQQESLDYQRQVEEMKKQVQIGAAADIARETEKGRASVTAEAARTTIDILEKQAKRLFTADNIASGVAQGLKYKGMSTVFGGTLFQDYEDSKLGFLTTITSAFTAQGKQFTDEDRRVMARVFPNEWDTAASRDLKLAKLRMLDPSQKAKFTDDDIQHLIDEVLASEFFSKAEREKFRASTKAARDKDQALKARGLRTSGELFVDQNKKYLPESLTVQPPSNPSVPPTQPTSTTTPEEDDVEVLRTIPSPKPQR